MPLHDRLARIPLSSISIARDSRQRRDLQLDEQFLTSIRLRGVIVPIVVEEREDGVWLLAGERRLEASRAAGLLDIPARFSSDLTEIERQLIELEENVKRRDLPWQDIVRSADRLHELHLALDPDWLMSQTAEQCALTAPTVSIYLKVAKELADARVVGCSTVREAYNLLVRRDQRKTGDVLSAFLEDPVEQTVAEPAEEFFDAEEPETEEPEPAAAGFAELADPGERAVVAQPAPRQRAAASSAPPPPPPSVLQTSFLDWAPAYSGPKFSLIHCDFPYGVDLFAGAQGQSAEGKEYDDSPDVYWKLLETLLVERDRFMSFSAHLIFWFSDRHEADGQSRTREMFARLAPEIQLFRYPLVWLKSDNAGVASDVRRFPRHVYETALFGTRNGRQLEKLVSDAYSAPSDRKFHPSAKPEPMLRHFLSMVVDPSTSLLDPTCGGGSSLLAADALGARSVLGLELSADYSQSAERRLLQARALRKATANG